MLIAVPTAGMLIDVAWGWRGPWRDLYHLMTGVKSGTLLGSAFFILLTQALSHRAPTIESETILAFVGFGFLMALLVDRSRWVVVPLSPQASVVLSAILHSAAGAAIGAVSHLSLNSGWVVVGTLLLQKSPSGTVVWAVAGPGSLLPRVVVSMLPLLALAASLAITASISLSLGFLNIMLGLSAGAGVYVCASMLVPESQHTHAQAPTLSMTVASSMIIYGLVQLT